MNKSSFQTGVSSVMVVHCSVFELFSFQGVTDCHSSAWNFFPLTCHSPSFGNGNISISMWGLRSGIAATRGLNVLGFNLTLLSSFPWPNSMLLFKALTKIWSVCLYFLIFSRTISSTFFNVFLKGHQQKEILAFYGSQDVNYHHPYINIFKQLLVTFLFN